MLENCRFVKHSNPIQSNWIGWIENSKGQLVAIVKLSGKIEMIKN